MVGGSGEKPVCRHPCVSNLIHSRLGRFSSPVLLSSRRRESQLASLSESSSHCPVLSPSAVEDSRLCSLSDSPSHQLTILELSLPRRGGASADQSSDLHTVSV
ncbi:hypothetical protein QN277_019729 [Acacia crassicarpa]|uniref:Uncharacterized protein n=1 Tax=Acacia crassicarpa TaxID=499986 RepID=A0AAE1JIA1_9FABA|nr:hypothetical protein QN277_019729 [Acacia crassicarpa]